MSNALLAFFGFTALGSALLVVVLRQPMRAALALIAHMISLAALFACLTVHVAALFQVLIYVGAVMVLMIYTIMLLDDRDTSYVHLFSRWSLPAVAILALVVFALHSLLATDAPPASAATPLTDAPFGFVAFSAAFMARYWLHFELATVLLLVSIVSVWTVISQKR
jgi:NADH-quinone oxidoreductase subunit J